MRDPVKKLKKILDKFQANLNSKNSWGKKCRLSLESLSECGELAMTLGYPGLLDLNLLFRDCLEAWQTGSNNDPDTMDIAVLASWSDAINEFLKSPHQEESKNNLIQIIKYPAWGNSISDEDADMLKQLLDIHIDNTGAQQTKTELDIGDEQVKDTVKKDSSILPEVNINSNLSPETRELITILVSELQNIRASIQKLLDQFNSGNSIENTEIKKLIHEITQQLEFYNDAVNSIGFEGLGNIINQARTNLADIDKEKENSRLSTLNLLFEMTDYIFNYLQNPVDRTSVESLVKFMQDNRWLNSLNNDLVDTFIQSLLAIPAATPSADKPGRLLQATEEDVSLKLPDDVDQDLLEAMLQELPSQSEELSSALQRLGNNGSLEDILVAKRIAHTLKGAGNTVGIKGIATLTHHLEDILLELHKHEIMPPPDVMQLLTNAADCLAIMSESLLGMGDPPEDALVVLQEILDMANAIDQQGLVALTSQDTGQETSKKRTDVKKPEEQTDKVESSEREPIAMLRVPATFIDNQLRLIGESKIMTGQIDNYIGETLRQIKNMQTCFDQLKSLGNKVEELTDIKDLTQLRNNSTSEQFDSLEMDQFTELHTYSKWLVETTVDAYETNQDISSNLLKLQNILANQTQINNETQENVFGARMLRADTHFQRLQRCVRQAAKLTGKPVDLHLEGADVMLDSDTLNSLLDPLMHLLRNAVDHGIESREERITRNKPETGNITLAFSKDGNNILVQCRDDGRGLDLESIRLKAIAEGLLKENQTVSDAELKQFILRPDFSTKTETTQVSGRGIGMDAVYASISALSGVMLLDSKAGQGCSIQIRLPQNTLSIFALLIRVGLHLMVIANRDIDRIIHHEIGKLFKTDDKWTYKVDKQEYTAILVEKLLNTFADRRSEERNARTALLYKTETGRTAVMVEKILGSGDFVVKGLGNYIPKIPGILGVTLLGDGTVTPVIDIAELLRQPLQSIGEGRYVRPDYIKPQLPVALVVDDSLSARRALTQFMQDAGYEVRQARDGLEAMDIIKAHKPDIILSDLEMPRMSGIELVGHIRADTSTADLPVIMITSRSALKHREEALSSGVNVYLTKPYSEEQLLEEIHKLRNPDLVTANE